MRLALLPSSAAPIVGSASGSYAESTEDYASTIDPIVNLKARVCRDIGFSKTIPLVLMHGLTQNAADFDAGTMRRFAERGFTVIAVGMRGRDSGGGTQDASAREIHDIADALAWARSTIAGVHQARAVISGYSGGGGNVYAAITKLTDLFCFWVVHFGVSDYAAFHAEGAAGSLATLESWVGDDPTAEPDSYAARNARGALGPVMAMTGAQRRLRIYHDTGDAAVVVSQSRAVDTELDADAPATYLYTESADGTYAHGLPADTPGIRDAEPAWCAEAIAAAPWAVPNSGILPVRGFLLTSRFGVWLGERLAPLPKADLTDALTGGGRSRTATLSYDLEVNEFTVTPISGDCYVQIIRADGRAITQLVTTTTTLSPVP